MALAKLGSVDQSLAFADNSMPQPLIDAWSYTTTFAQAHARTVNIDPSTQAYFDAMTQQLQEIGWNVTNAGRLNYQQEANKISPADIVKSIIHPYLSPEQQRQLDGLLNAIAQPDVSISNFLDFWWKKASVSASKTNMAMGPLTEVNNSSDITLIYYGFNYSADSWRSLFIEHDSASLGVVAYNLEMNLNFALYNSVKGDLIAKIAGKEKEHIQQTTLDL
jgi:hypothetical protein